MRANLQWVDRAARPNQESQRQPLGSEHRENLDWSEAFNRVERRARLFQSDGHQSFGFPHQGTARRICSAVTQNLPLRI